MQLHRFMLCLFAGVLLVLPVQAQQSIKSPSEYLDYELGSQWTPHYKVIGYFRHVATSSPMVRLKQYGTTNEGRELVLATVSSEANMKRIEAIRTDNLKRAGLLQGDPSGDSTAIVWLSYNVHGNETSSSEAAMKTIYELVRPGNGETKRWLENTVVLIDPMLNPDGRDRYVHWFRETAGDDVNLHKDAREHHEPWPGGRTNHYYFDLNRDWAWLTQVESRQRIAEYQRWMPHIHVDYHEQYYNEPYYFAPAAEPFHKAITGWQREFQYTIGKNHVRYFDQNNWLYFTREVFDLFYPSYGDTYPIFNGSIGMTYEQGGHSMAGLGIVKEEGDTLTLHDRLIHHYTTGLSTIEATSRNASKVVEEFAGYFRDAMENPPGTYKSFVIDGDNNPDKIRALFDLLDRHQVAYGKAPERKTYTGYNYQMGRNERVTVDTDDYIIDLHQPKGVLARVFFEPRPSLSDSLTYDITAWEQHYAFGLDGYALTDRINPVEAAPPAPPAVPEISGKPYAYLAEWKSPEDVQLLTRLLKEGVHVRVANDPFTIDGRSYAPGTLVITRNGNEQMGAQFDRVIQEAAGELGQPVYPVGTGFVESGHDFGSDAVDYLDAPRVALLTGEGTSSNMVGEVWHYFDRKIDYPVTLIDNDHFNSIELADYDVLVLVSGGYHGMLGDEGLKRIREWITDGGRLIALRGANTFLAGQEGFELKRKLENGENDEQPSEKLDIYDQRQRIRITHRNSGSVFRITMDPTHPLGFGYGDTYFSLKQDAEAYAYLENGWNVGVVEENAAMSGFVGHQAIQKLENTLTFGVQNMGEGAVIYMVDNPLFRAFWYNGKLLFANAVFMVD